MCFLSQEHLRALPGPGVLLTKLRKDAGLERGSEQALEFWLLCTTSQARASCCRSPTARALGTDAAAG
jgi:hypothetical protein